MAKEKASAVGSQRTMSTRSSPSVYTSTVLTAAKGGGVLFGATAIAYALRFLLGIVQARSLGSEQYGLLNLSLTAATLASGLTLFGLTPALVRYVSLFNSRRDQAGVWGALLAGIGLPTGTSLLVGGALFALAEPIALRVFRDPGLVPLLRIMAFVVPFLTLFSVSAAATRGFKRMQDTAIASIFRPILRLILIVVVIATIGLTASRAAAVFGVAIAVTSILLLFLLNRIFSLRRPLRERRPVMKEMLRFGLPVYGSGLIGMFSPYLRTLLLGAMYATADVGILAVATQVNTVGALFHSSIATASAPIISELYEREDMEQMKQIYQITSKWTFTLNLPLFLVVVLFPVPILSVFGKDYILGVTALTILAWTNLIATGTGLGSTIIGMTGRTSLKLVNTLVTTTLSIGTSIWLIPQWGVVGAAAAALATSIVGNVLRLVEVYVLYRMLPYNMSFLKPVLSGLVALAVAWGLDRLLPMQVVLLRTAIAVIALLAAYAAMILLLGLAPEDRMVLTRVVKRFFPMLSNRHSETGEIE